MYIQIIYLFTNHLLSKFYLQNNFIYVQIKIKINENVLVYTYMLT